MRCKLCLVLTTLLLSALVFGHGSQQHVMGTVAAISAQSITVRTTAGQLTEVSINQKTAFSRAGKKIDLKQIKIGDRVVIHAMKQEHGLEATTVQVGALGQRADQTGQVP
jgi:hypothetical protein